MQRPSTVPSSTSKAATGVVVLFRLSSWVIAPLLPGLIGRPGWVRSRAWIWLFSSTERTTACRGGSRGARIERLAAVAPYPFGSGDAGVARASELQHAVEHVGGDRHLGRPALVGARAQPIADHPLPPRDGGLGLGAPVVP